MARAITPSQACWRVKGEDSVIAKGVASLPALRGSRHGQFGDEKAAAPRWGAARQCAKKCMRLLQHEQKPFLPLQQNNPPSSELLASGRRIVQAFLHAQSTPPRNLLGPTGARSPHQPHRKGKQTVTRNRRPSFTICVVNAAFAGKCRPIRSRTFRRPIPVPWLIRSDDGRKSFSTTSSN